MMINVIHERQAREFAKVGADAAWIRPTGRLAGRVGTSASASSSSASTARATGVGHIGNVVD